MKLFFDENLSPRSAVRIADIFPGSSSVEALRMRGCSDGELFQYAAKHEFVLVSKDDDFRQMSFVLGHPPKVVWLSVGNATPHEIEGLLRRQLARLRDFDAHDVESLLVLELKPAG